MPMFILDTLEIILNRRRNITRAIVGAVSIVIVLLIFSSGISNADVQVDVSVEDISRWSLPKAAKARLGKGGINVLAFSPDGTQLAVGSNIGVWLYDVTTGKEIAMFPGMCQSVAFSPDGHYLANGGGWFREHVPQMWEIATRQEVSRWDHLYAGRKLQFSSDGRTLISLDGRGSAINKLDVETGTRSGVTAIEGRSRDQLRRQSGPESYALTDDKIAVGSTDGTITLWDATTGEKQLTLTDVGAQIPLVDDENLRLREGRIRLPADRAKRVLVLAFSADSTRLASGGNDSVVRLWGTADTEMPIVLQQHTGWINALAFSRDGRMLASGSTDKMVHLWDATTGERLATFSGHLSVVTALVFSPDGQTLASGSVDGTVRFWNTETAEALSLRITGHTESVKAVSFLEGGSTLASVAFGGIITLWDAKTLERTDIRTSGQKGILSAAAFSPDGTQLANVVVRGEMHFDPSSGVSLTTSGAGGQMVLMDTRTGRELAIFRGIKSGSPSRKRMVFSPDGEAVALGGSRGISVWDTSTMDRNVFLDILLTESVAINEKGNGRLPQAPMPPFHDQVTALIFTPDGKKLVGGTIEGKVRMWDAETGVALASLLEGKDPRRGEGDNFTVSYLDGISALAYSGDGDLLAVGSYQRTRLLGRHKQIRLKEIPRGSDALVFSPDRTVLVRASSFGSIDLWDLTTGTKLSTLNGHTAAVNTLIFSPDGKTLVSAGGDGTILLWDWDAAREGSERMVD